MFSLMFVRIIVHHAVQVYGGAIGVIVGPYAWSMALTGSSSASCADTACANCSVHISGTSITNSRALSYTLGNFAANFVLTCANYRRFSPTMISDAVHRQLLRGVCKSDGRRVQHTARLTCAPQVYGGGVAFVVQPHVWSSNIRSGTSSASAEDTVVSGLSAVFFNCSFFGSTALTQTTGA